MEKSVDTIINKALEDYYKEDYASAHEKYQWFFENAEKIDPAMSGVRVSFCLSGWVNVAKKYPPAMNQLMLLKREAFEEFTETGSSKIFNDYSCMSYYLGFGDDVLDVFFKYHHSNKDIARKIFRSSYSFLVKKEEWLICAAYMDEFTERYDLSLYVYDKVSKRQVSVGKQSVKELRQSYVDQLQNGILPLFKIMLCKDNRSQYSEYLKKAEQDLKARGLDDLYSRISSLSKP